jgi:microsomal epoxide hydrolase
MTTETAVRPFKIDVAESVLEDLRERLRRTRWPGEIGGSGWTYGTNLDYLKDLVRYWLDEYDWRAQEAALNRLPQFTATVDGLEIHFVHVRGTGPDPLPLIISHGWPGSFAEMVEVIGPLADPAAHGGDAVDAFDVVVPSLPGYGFSQHSQQPGMTPRRIGEIFVKLMTDVLGYERFAAQGGDWGSLITAAMARQFPERLLGIHLNMLGVRPNTGPGTPPLTEEEQAYLQSVQTGRDEETGYQRIQGTRPQTLAYGLTDSPVGLAAWIVEKFRTWTDCGGSVETAVSRDELLANIALYWFTGAIGSSFWPYYARMHGPWPIADGRSVTAPMGYAEFPKEILRPPRSLAEKVYADIRRWSVMDKGGHFAALEQPEALAREVREFFRALG